MKNILKIKALTGVCLLLSMIVFFMPIARFGEISISLWDMVNMSSDITELMDTFELTSELIADEIQSYFVFCIVLLLLPVIICLLLFVIPNKLGFIVSIAGTLINNVMAYIVYDKIGSTISLLKEAISFFDMDMEISTVKGTIALWCVLSVFIFAASVLGLLIGEIGTKPISRFKPMKAILPEEIASSPLKPTDSEVPHFVSEMAQPFYGGLKGESGIFKDKVRLFQQEEALLVGTDGEHCHIWINSSAKGIRYGVLSYDERMKEYHVKPLCTKGIFLQSGQPLGKDRTYCLPRGTKILIDNQNHVFTLV